MATRPTTQNQLSVLGALQRHRTWSRKSFSWKRGNISTTERMLDVLLAKGLVTKDGDGIYRISATGLEELAR